MRIISFVCAAVGCQLFQQEMTNKQMAQLNAELKTAQLKWVFILLHSFFLSVTLVLMLVIEYLPSVLWRCWLGGRKGIQPVKKLSGEVLAWSFVWSEVQMVCVWSTWCYCHLIISCSSKIQKGLLFWCRLTQVVLIRRPLNGCSSSSS